MAATSSSGVDLNDHLVAARLAEDAGDVLLELRARIGVDLSADEARREGDRTSHAFLVNELARVRPHDGVLSEEGRDDHQRLLLERVWILDPLDGTREFGEPPRDDWAVHVALACRGQAVAGAVALPGRRLVFSSASDYPATSPGGPLRMVVSRTRPPSTVMAVAAALGAEVTPMGSAGAKTMAVVTGAADIYFHAGGQYEWDSAAPVAVVVRAGLHASRADGSPLIYNRPDPLLPDLLVCRKEIADEVLEAIARSHVGPA